MPDNSRIQLPLFPLSTLVLPDGLLPLRLFEPRYINMVKSCFKNTSGFGVCLIKEGGEAGVPAVPYPQGTSVSIVDFDQGRDGLLHITAKGDQEFTLHDYAVQEDGLLVGEISMHEPRPATAMNTDIMALAQKLDVILDYLEPGVKYEEKQLDDPDWVCHRLLEVLPVSTKMKFDLLQMEDNAQRLAALSALRIEIANREM